MKDQTISLLRELTHTHGAPGGEHPIRELVCRELEHHTFEHDKLGSLICRRAGSGDGPTVLITAHMDEVGFTVQNITSTGFIRFAPLGSWWNQTLLAQRVRIRTQSDDEIVGVISSIPPHFLDSAARDQVQSMDKLYIDVGADSKEEVVRAYGIGLGDPIVPDADMRILQNPDRLMAKAFDNRVGVGLLIQSLQLLRDEPLPNQLVGLGTVQEELGSRGAETAGWSIRPDAAIILEGPPADDGPGFPRDEAQGRLGGGVQIRIQDPTALMNRALIDLAVETARGLKLPYQLAVRRWGGTDARRLQRVMDGVPVVVLGVPSRYIHTHNSIIDIHDYSAALQLVIAMVKRMDQKAVTALRPQPS